MISDLIQGIYAIVVGYTRLSVNHGKMLEQQKNFWWIRWNLWYIWELEQGISYEL